MALNQLERDLLQQAATEAAKAHTKASETCVAVKNIESNQSELFSRTKKAEAAIVQLKTRQEDCGARKSFEAGVMPGAKSSKRAAFWAMIAGIAAGGSMIGALVVPIIKVFVSKIFGQT